MEFVYFNQCVIYSCTLQCSGCIDILIGSFVNMFFLSTVILLISGANRIGEENGELGGCSRKEYTL